MFESKCFMKCAICGERFEGYNLAICDPCLAKKKPNEDHMLFVQRMKEEKKAKNRVKTYFKLSPELVDGEHWTPTDDIKVVLDSVRAWCEDFNDCVGESFEIEVIEMTEAEFEALPDI